LERGLMDWFRWHHGSVTDPKFRLVAKRAQASVAEVVAVWAFVLETASQNPERGAFGEIDAEALDLALGMDDGATARILAAMHDRTLIADGRIPAWDKRQPKREDNTAAERQRLKRQREQELALAQAAAVTGDASRTVTQCHAASRAVTPEEKRGEEKDQELSKASLSHPSDDGAGDGSGEKGKRKPKPDPEPVCAVVVDAYHRRLPKCLPARTLNPKRRRRILTANTLAKQLIKRQGLELSVEEFWDAYFAECEADAWLRGEVPNPNNPKWRQNIDVLLAEDRFASIMDSALARELGAAA